MPKRDAEHMKGQRERILRATIECIAQKGVEGMSMADIRKQSGLSTGAIYLHFANREEIVAEALRYGVVRAIDLPDDWASFKALMANLDSQMGFDIETVVRTRLHLRAECAHPGRVHDLFRPILEDAIDIVAAHLESMAASGALILKMPARQTALGMSAFVDGMLWMALATDRPLLDLKPELSAGLDLFVTAGERPT
jgi:AcrR family transcriptional regulator